MNKIRDFYQFVGGIAPPDQKKFESQVRIYRTIKDQGIYKTLTNENTEDRSVNLQSRYIQLQPGDLVCSLLDCHDWKIIEKIELADPVFISSGAYMVLRPRTPEPLLPAWAIIYSARRMWSLWTSGTFSGRANPKEVLDHKFEPMPEQNILGEKLIKSLSHMIELHKKTAQLMEQMQTGICQRMIKNLPIKDKAKPTEHATT